MNRESKIADSLVSKVAASGGWSWELIGADGRTVGLQLVYTLGKRYVKIDELNELVKVMRTKAGADMAILKKSGLPLNLASIDLKGEEVASEEGRLEMFVNISVKLEKEGYFHEDVHELMHEAGLM